MTLAVGTDAIESPRLLLRRLQPSDLEFFATIHADPDVARYIGTGNPRTRAQSETWLHAVLQTYAQANLGQLAVVRKDGGALVGRCGLSDAAIEQGPADERVRRGWFFRDQVPPGINVEPLPELGYTFAKQYWGLGYASEAAGLVYHYARTTLEVGRIMSVIDQDNRASLAVALKFGVKYIDSVEFGGKPFDRYHWQMAES